MPLLRFALALIGLGVVLVLLVFGLLIGSAMLAIGIVRRLLRQRGRPIAATKPSAGTIEGEYRILRKPSLPSRFASIR
jgi:hypothetical protein